MKIALLEYYKNDKIVSFGVHHETCNDGRTKINLFRLKENDGDEISRHLWGIRDYLSSDIYPGMQKDKIDWTLTSGYVTSDLVFEEIYGHPAQLKMSNSRAIYFLPFDLGKYQKEYMEINGKPFRKEDLLVQKHELQQEPLAVFAVPCAKAEDGVFYCKPEFYDGDLRKNYHCFIASTPHLLKRIERDEPRMINHAQFKFRGETGEEWLECNSVQNAYETGSFVVKSADSDAYISEETELSFSSGNAGLLMLMQDLELPFVPVGVEKGGWEEGYIRKHYVQSLRDDIGYVSQGPSNQNKLRPD